MLIEDFNSWRNDHAHAGSLQNLKQQLNDFSENITEHLQSHCLGIPLR